MFCFKNNIISAGTEKSYRTADHVEIFLRCHRKHIFNLQHIGFAKQRNIFKRILCRFFKYSLARCIARCRCECNNIHIIGAALCKTQKKLRINRRDTRRPSLYEFKSQTTQDVYYLQLI